MRKEKGQVSNIRNCGFISRGSQNSHKITGSSVVLSEHGRVYVRIISTIYGIKVYFDPEMGA